ncbi:amino acid ABC transporter permease [Eikenella sp. S3360]|uniref:Amino acid ABC transporter permease n=1 Tax=Eikenella glucosivorans TaxID=2766967 RepID=A0ABS0N8N4_9NEIS|nr:amino acid ABC transporter permease [Eikenella glucosivorans]MBH5328645.1 amino acid ABC transporter permease [Eikenella glucosivorans]
MNSETGLIQMFSQHFPIIYEYRQMFFYGVLATIGIAAASTFLGVVLGLINALIRVIKIEKGNMFTRSVLWLLQQCSRLYVTLFRGTPMLVQVFIWHFVWSPMLVHQQHGLLISGESALYLRQTYGALVAGILALSFNSGAYITEVFRSGIKSIDRGQMEAARSLGLSYGQAMRHIILPQTLRRMLGPLGNEFITLLKDSSLLSTIGVAELLYAAKSATGRYLTYEEPYYFIALVYLMLTMVLAWFFARLEKKYNTDGNR